MRTLRFCSAMLAAVAFPAIAQTVQFACPIQQGRGAVLLTVDFDARTFTHDSLDEAGNSIVAKDFQKMPAQFSESDIVATWRNGRDYMRFILNRHSGILATESDFGAGVTRGYTKPCEPYLKPQRRF